MAFNPLNNAEIDVGDPTKKELWDKIQGNFNDHEERVNDLENVNAKVIVFDLTVKNAISAVSLTGLAYAEAFFNFHLTGCEVRIFEKGSLSGYLQIDIKKSTSGLNSSDFTSVFTTKPQINLTAASNYERSTNQVFNPAQIEMNAGDSLRLDVTVMPESGVLGKFRVILYGEV